MSSVKKFSLHSQNYVILLAITWRDILRATKCTLEKREGDHKKIRQRMREIKGTH